MREPIRGKFAKNSASVLPLALFFASLCLRNLPAFSAPWYPFAIASATNIVFNGNTIQVDSFNSTSVLYSDWYSNLGYGTYDINKARSHARIGTDSDAVGAISIGNASIFGTVQTAPGGTITISTNGYVGPLPQIGSGIQPGYSNALMNMTFRDVTLPDHASGWPTVPPGNVIIYSGNYYMPALSGSLNIQASNVTIYVAGNISITGINTITIGTNASNVTMYIAGPAVDVSSLTGINNLAQNASYFTILGLPTLTSFHLGCSMTGTIYAPEAAFQFGTGGFITCDFIGALVAWSVTVSGHSNFHFDESLAAPSTSAPLWFYLQPQDRATILGYQVSFHSVIDGIPMNCQWFFNDTNALPAATNSDLVISNAQLSDVGSYSIVATNFYGSVTSTPASLTVYTNVSVTVSPPQLYTNGCVSFSSSVPSGLVFFPQASTNLVDWTSTGLLRSLLILTNQWDSTYTDTQATNFPQRYYRVVFIPL